MSKNVKGEYLFQEGNNIKKQKNYYRKDFHFHILTKNPKGKNKKKLNVWISHLVISATSHLVLKLNSLPLGDHYRREIELN